MSEITKYHEILSEKKKEPYFNKIVSDLQRKDAKVSKEHRIFVIIAYEEMDNPTNLFNLLCQKISLRQINVKQLVELYYELKDICAKDK